MKKILIISILLLSACQNQETGSIGVSVAWPSISPTPSPSNLKVSSDEEEPGTYLLVEVK